MFLEIIPQKKLEASKNKLLQGIVVSDKMEKSIVVEIYRRKLHPLYQKYITIKKKIMAHDEKNQAQIGDSVQVLESRPLSKRKRWTLASVVERVQ